MQILFDTTSRKRSKYWHNRAKLVTETTVYFVDVSTVSIADHSHLEYESYLELICIWQNAFVAIVTVKMKCLFYSLNRNMCRYWKPVMSPASRATLHFIPPQFNIVILLFSIYNGSLILIPIDFDPNPHTLYTTSIAINRHLLSVFFTQPFWRDINHIVLSLLKDRMNIMHCAALNNNTAIVKYIIDDLQMKQLDKPDKVKHLDLEIWVQVSVSKIQ